MSIEQWKKNRIHQEGRPQPPDQIRFPQSIAPMRARNDALPLRRMSGVGLRERRPSAFGLHSRRLLLDVNDVNHRMDGGEKREEGCTRKKEEVNGRAMLVMIMYSIQHAPGIESYRGHLGMLQSELESPELLSSR
jgi:hypothetical protein